MLPWESKFDTKFLLMVFDGKIFWVVHHTPSGSLSVKTPVLVGLIAKW